MDMIMFTAASFIIKNWKQHKWMAINKMDFWLLVTEYYVVIKRNKFDQIHLIAYIPRLEIVMLKKGHSS